MDDFNLYNQFLTLHQQQLVSSAVPEHFWPSLYQKLMGDIFDAGNSFQLMLIDYNSSETDESLPVFQLNVIKEEGIKANHPNEIYLIDHAWTFKSTEARSLLEQLPSLADRMSAITGIDLEDPQRLDKIMDRLWKYCQTYSIQNEGRSIEESMPIWYIMDEVGSAVNHSDEPNFRIVPFIFILNQMTYSLMFPIKDCSEGEKVLRNFIENIAFTAIDREALLLPWKNYDGKNESFEQSEPNEEYFTSGHTPETIPDDTHRSPIIDRNQPIKVYSEYDVLTKNLTSSYFQIVDNAQEADVLWLTNHFKNFKELCKETPNKFINQFPYEYVLTIKDLLAAICRRRVEKHNDPITLQTNPIWLPTTYNLKSELIEFVSYFQNRSEKYLDNSWIIKPWNLARGLDIEITSNLSKIIRLQTTGPKIAQKYIENPVLINRSEINAKVKFDIRYVILMKSVEPLIAYVHKKFYLRFANKEFALTDFDNYERHFTVMNYKKDFHLKHIKCEEFREIWSDQHGIEWDLIEIKIIEMLNEMLLCAVHSKPPCGLAPCSNSRAIYAADIMLAWENNTIQPKLLEINWMPDCKRACKYYPEFYNDCFKLLFLDEDDSGEFIEITRK